MLVLWKAVVDVKCKLQRVVNKKACHWLHSTTRCRLGYTVGPQRPSILVLLLNFMRSAPVVRASGCVVARSR